MTLIVIIIMSNYYEHYYLLFFIRALYANGAIYSIKQIQISYYDMINNHINILILDILTHKKGRLKIYVHVSHHNIYVHTYILCLRVQ